MAFAEMFGRKGSADSRERVYCGAAASEDAALTDLLTAAPSTLNGFARVEYDVDEVENTGYYIGRVRYGSLATEGSQEQPGAAGDETFSFDTTGGTAHINQSLETVGHFGNGGAFTPADADGVFGGAINVDGDGTVRGLDVPTPKFKFTVRTIVASGSMTVSYIRTIYELTGSTNDAAVAISVFGTDIDFAEQEVLFLGGRGSKSTSGDWNVDFDFEAMEPFGPEDVGPITAVAAKGTQYRWAYMVQKTREATTGGEKVLATVPKFIMVERVFPLKDFTDLGVVGTPAP